MEYFEIAPTKIVRNGVDTFTYNSSTKLFVGSIIAIPVGSKLLIGVVIKKVSKPSYETKSVGDLIEEKPLPIGLVKLALWMAEYYHTPLATVLQTILPSGLAVKRRNQKTLEIKSGIRHRTNIVFNKEQRVVLDSLSKLGVGTTLLQGVTGSGKTEIYKEMARRTTASGKSVVVLVPEISLTGQIVDEFRQEFPDAVLTHSKMTDATRHKIWQSLLNNNKPSVVIGPRSALFMPVANLGLIVVDEAHEPSYKQDKSPRYSALRAASILGNNSDSLVILGSATPAIADRFTADNLGSMVLKLTKTARKDARSSVVSLVDMKKRDQFKKHRFLSDQLLNQIEANIASHKQTLIFHNRRGSASSTLCESCGWTAMCPTCFIPLVLHSDKFLLSCHVCNYRQKVPLSCPDCGSTDIIHKGIGTKLIESELKKLFPRANIARFDSDNSSEETVNQRYKELYDGSIDIAIGTQVIAKGLDLPKLHTVAVIQADSGLVLPDFSSSERVFQLLAQVVGRVGRFKHDTNVLIQSYQPDNPVIQFGIKQDFEGFYNYAINIRKQGGFPPFRYLLKLTNSYKSEAAAVKSAKALVADLKAKLPSTVEVLEPVPAFYERLRDSFRWQVTIKSRRRADLIEALKFLPPTHWQYDLDPSSLL